jgi:glutamate synthase (NADPH/NADH) large chain
MPPDLKVKKFYGKGVQVASGRFAIDIEVIVTADEIEIKIAQAAKVGEGGQLARFKNIAEIAEARGCEPGIDLYSMGAHASIKSIEDLAQLIYGLKQANPKARVAVKCAAMHGIDTILVGAVKCGADRVHMAGTGGGTGAANRISQQHTSMPWEIYGRSAARKLVSQDYRGKAILSNDGGISSSYDVIFSRLIGFEESHLGKSLMYVLGCKNMGVCNAIDAECAFGNATMNPALRQNYDGKPEYVARYFQLMAAGIQRQLVALGVKSLDEIHGNMDYVSHARMKDRGLDFSGIFERFAGDNRRCELKPSERNEYIDPLYPNGRPFDVAAYHAGTVAYPGDERIFREFRAEILDAFPWSSKRMIVTNSDRNIGTRLSNYITEEFGAALPNPEQIKLNVEGYMGQQACLLLARGITVDFMGVSANNGAGECLSAGTLILRPKPGTHAARSPQNHTIALDNCLYAAKRGRAYFAGRVEDNFGFLNAGAEFVCEGMGANGLRFALGGKGVCLGSTGPGLLSLASSGRWVFFDPKNDLIDRIDSRAKGALLRLDELEDDQEWVHDLIEEHVRLTGSSHAQRFLDNWNPRLMSQFKLVAPKILLGAE